MAVSDQSPSTCPTTSPQTSKKGSSIISRFAFLFLIYAIITSGYVTETLSCQMQHFLTTTKHGRHIFGIAMVFAFIMLEGGWSMDKDQDDLADNDWSSGNVLHTMVIAAILYVVFMISSKSRLVPNLIFMGLVFLIYCVNTQRSFWHKRNQISEENNERMLVLGRFLLIMAISVLIYGFMDYMSYQKAKYGQNFNMMKFLFLSEKCDSVHELRHHD